MAKQLNMDIIPRQQYDERMPNYVEGDRDYVLNNIEAAVILLDNAEKIKKAIELLQHSCKVMKKTNAIVCEGACSKGFDPSVGDWAERLYANQGVLHLAYKNVEDILLELLNERIITNE